MARIRFNITTALARWRVRSPVSLQRFRMMDLASLMDRPHGPGWFDSSWDLDHGLEVAVALPGDPPFMAWIEAQARAVAFSSGSPHAAAPAQNMLEFEPVQWTAPSAQDTVSTLLPAWQPPPCDETGLKLELQIPELELELALV